MSDDFRPARRAGVKLMIGLAGPSGSGKTYSALLIAKGMQEIDGGEIFFIDTENRRSEHYADDFDFRIGELTAPFNPRSYLAKIEAAVKAGAKIIVIDSASHMHEGEGGLLDAIDKFLDKVAGADEKKREKQTMRAHIAPKRELGLFVNRLLQIDAHFIFCFRAQEKIKPIKNGNGSTVPTSLGIQPIAGNRLPYEMTMLLVLPGVEKGVPDLRAPATKLPEPMRPIMQEGFRLEVGLGRILARWAKGEKVGEPRAVADNRTSSERQEGRQEQQAPAPSGPLSEAIVAYRKELGHATDEDDLGARHDGSENFPLILEGEKVLARRVYKLNLQRLRGEIEPDDFNTAIRDLFAQEPA